MSMREYKNKLIKVNQKESFLTEQEESYRRALCPIVFAFVKKQSKGEQSLSLDGGWRVQFERDSDGDWWVLLSNSNDNLLLEARGEIEEYADLRAREEDFSFIDPLSPDSENPKILYCLSSIQTNIPVLAIELIGESVQETLFREQISKKIHELEKWERILDSRIDKISVL